MVYKKNAGRLGAGFISVCLETRWLGQKHGFYVPEWLCNLSSIQVCWCYVFFFLVQTNGFRTSPNCRQPSNLFPDSPPWALRVARNLLQGSASACLRGGQISLIFFPADFSKCSVLGIRVSYGESGLVWPKGSRTRMFTTQTSSTCLAVVCDIRSC